MINFNKKANYCFILFLLSILIYFPILNNELLDFWDDQWVVMNHYTESGINLKNIWNILTQFYHGQYAPFNEFLYLFLYNLSGYNPFIFHLSSLIIHFANSCLVFIVVSKLLAMSKRINNANLNNLSFLTAIIFCIHPMNVESVAWMSASKVLVYALFYLLATYTFLLYIEKDKLQYYLYTIILFIFSFLGKEQAVTFPIWVLLIYWVINIDFSRRKILLSVLPFFILSIIFGVITILSQAAYGGSVISNQAIYPFYQRTIFACYSFFEYLFKAILPVKLSYLYPFPNVIGDPVPLWMLFYPIILLVIVSTLWKYITKPPLLFGLLYFTIHIAIALHIIPLSRFAIVADRYAYIAIIGGGFIAAYYIIYIYNKIIKKNIRILSMILLTSYFSYLGVYAHQRTYKWYNVDTLKEEIRELIKHRQDYNYKQ